MSGSSECIGSEFHVRPITCGRSWRTGKFCEAYIGLKPWSVWEWWMAVRVVNDWLPRGLVRARAMWIGLLWPGHSLSIDTILISAAPAEPPSSVVGRTYRSDRTTQVDRAATEPSYRSAPKGADSESFVRRQAAFRAKRFAADQRFVSSIILFRGVGPPFGGAASFSHFQQWQLTVRDTVRVRVSPLVVAISRTIPCNDHEWRLSEWRALRNGGPEPVQAMWRTRTGWFKSARLLLAS